MGEPQRSGESARWVDIHGVPRICEANDQHVVAAEKCARLAEVLNPTRIPDLDAFQIILRVDRNCCANLLVLVVVQFLVAPLIGRGADLTPKN